MAAQVTKTGLLAKLGNRLTQAQQEHKGREPVVGQQDLPAGIKNGIAQLRGITWGEFGPDTRNPGKPYFSAWGAVMEPHSVKVDGREVIVEGGRTQIRPEPMFDTPDAGGKRKTFSDHYGFVRDTLINLGFNIDNLKGTPEQVEAQIFAGCAALVRQSTGPDPSKAIYFGFRTWGGGSNPPIEQRADGKWFCGKQDKLYATREMAEKGNPYAGKEGLVNHEWHRVVDWQPGGTAVDPGAGTQDGTVGDPSANGQELEGSGSTFNEFEGGEAAEGAAMAGAEAEGGEAGGDEEEVDLAALLEQAMSEDELEAEKAQQSIVEIGKQFGLELDSPEIQSWAEAVQKIEEANSAAEGVEEGEAEAPAEEAPPPPPPPAPLGSAKGPKVCKYQPLDPKTKKPALTKAKKPMLVECEIVASDAKAKTCTLKSLEDGKTQYKGVKWDALKPAK